MTSTFSRTTYKSAANRFTRLDALVFLAPQANPALLLGSLALRRKEVEQVLRLVVDSSVVVQLRHGSPSKPTNFFNLLLMLTKKLIPVDLKIRAVCSSETSALLQGGVDALVVASQPLRTHPLCSSRSFASLAPESLSFAPGIPAVSISVTRARLHASSQLPP